MDIKQMKKAEVEQEEEVKFEWPEAFYLPTEGNERKEALEKAIFLGFDSEENIIRKEILERRYDVQPGVDQFLTAWMNLLYYANVVGFGFMARFHKKEMQKTQKMLCFDVAKKYGEKGEELLYMELYHLVDFYIDICQRDKKYNGIILGLGTMKTEKQIEKIAGEIYRVCYGISPALGVNNEYEFLIKAATDCYYSRFPRQKDVLQGMIVRQG